MSDGKCVTKTGRRSGEIDLCVKALKRKTADGDLNCECEELWASTTELIVQVWKALTNCQVFQPLNRTKRLAIALHRP